MNILKHSKMSWSNHIPDMFSMRNYNMPMLNCSLSYQPFKPIPRRMAEDCGYPLNKEYIMGNKNYSISTANVMYGDENTVMGYESIVIGNKNFINVGNKNIIRGNSNKIDGCSNIVIGSGNIIEGDNNKIFYMNNVKIRSNNKRIHRLRKFKIFKKGNHHEVGLYDIVLDYIV
jgi:hypothetical protein